MNIIYKPMFKLVAQIHKYYSISVHTIVYLALSIFLTYILYCSRLCEAVQS